MTAPADSLALTFERLLASGEFPKRIHTMLKRLEEAYRVPVDIEFAIEEGQAIFDFLKGDEAYKFRLGAEPRPLFQVAAP